MFYHPPINNTTLAEKHMATRLNRQRTNLPDLYYEGYLEKRSFRDKASLNLWTCLCGNALFFFNSVKDTNYVEKLDIVDFKSVTDDLSRDQNLDKARFNIRLKDRNLKFTAPSLEARELWKGYIHAVVELSVRSDLTLLPGQIRDLQEAVEKEKERRKTPQVLLPAPLLVHEVQARGRSHSGYEGHLPACYMQVSRVEAELLLEREAHRGNLLLRPGGHGNTFTMTTREGLDRPIFKHYRVTQKPGEGFIIDLQKPIPCATLDDVITLMLKETGGTLTPFIMEEDYEDTISFIKSNVENGETSVCIVTSSNAPPAPPPKPAPIKSNVENGTTATSRAAPAPPPKPAPGRGSLVFAQRLEDDELYLSEEEDKVYLTVNEGPSIRIPPFATRSDEIGETIIWQRPSNPPPPLPNEPTNNAAEGQPLMQRHRIALMPPTPVMSDSQSSHETNTDDQVMPLKPVPAPRRFPPSGHYSTPTRSRSDAGGISEELKQIFLKKRLFKE